MPQLTPTVSRQGPTSKGPGRPQIAPDDLTDIVRYLEQFTKWKFKTPLSPDDYFWRVEQLSAQLWLTGTALTAQIVYHGPANFNGLLYGVTPILAMQAMETEPNSIPGIGNPTVLDRIMIKAQNTVCAFQNVDRGQKIFGTASKNLSDLFPQWAGDQNLRFDPPYVLADGEQLELDLSTQDATSTIIGSQTLVGVACNFLFVRTRP